MRSVACLLAGTFQIVRTLDSALDRERAGWLHRQSLEAVVVYGEFPARRDGFPVPDHRESVATTAERMANLGSDAARRV